MKILSPATMRLNPIIISSSCRNNSLFSRVEVNLLDSCFMFVDNCFNPGDFPRWIKILIPYPVTLISLSYIALLTISQCDTK
jgi:hypothetical protein